MSIICYRDYSDKVQFEILPFTTDLSLPEKFLEKIEAKGGGDAPEDVAGAFKKALE